MEQLPLQEVPLEAIEIDDPEMPPFRFDRGDLTGLKDSIERLGLLVPPIVWRAGPTKWVVIDGNRRVAALQELRCEYEDVDEDEQRIFPLRSIHVAVFCGTLVAAERLRAVLHLCVAQSNRGDEALASLWLESHAPRGEGGAKSRRSAQAYVADLADRDQTWVSHSNAFALGLAPAVLQQFRRRRSKITAKHAHKMVKLVTPEGEPDLARQLEIVDAIQVRKPGDGPPRGPGRSKGKARRWSVWPVDEQGRVAADATAAGEVAAAAQEGGEA